VAERQHFVPEVYLRRFTRNASGFFFKASHKPNFLQIESRPVSRVCFYDDYYNLKAPEILRDRTVLEDLNFIERNAFDYESNLNETLNCFVTCGDSIPHQKVRELIEVILKLKQRNPFNRESFRKEHSDTESTKVILDREGEKLKDFLLQNTKHPEETIKTIIENSKDKILANDKFHEEAHKRILIDTYLGDNEAMDNAVKVILALGVTVLRPINTSTYFITSDNPGFSLLGDKVFNTNYGNFDRVGFPMSSKVAVLFGGFDKTVGQPTRRVNSISMTDEQMEIFNYCTIFNCCDSLFCGDKDYLTKLIDRFVKTKKFLT